MRADEQLVKDIENTIDLSSETIGKLASTGKNTAYWRGKQSGLTQYLYEVKEMARGYKAMYDKLVALKDCSVCEFNDACRGSYMGCFVAADPLDLKDSV